MRLLENLKLCVWLSCVACTVFPLDGTGRNSRSCSHQVLPHSTQQEGEGANEGMPLPLEDVSWMLHTVFLLISYWLELVT